MKNLLESVDEAQIREVFGKFGEITSVSIKEPETTPSHITQKTKYGFINFKTHDEAKKVLDRVQQ